MIKDRKNTDKNKADRINSTRQSYDPNGKRNSSPRQRIVLLPPKQGTVSREVIKKAVREIIKRRSIA